jgi:hypothetical protein
LSLLVPAILVLAAAPRAAQAIPSFARKYETSCLTCHVVYPKLNPFGEAYRRNGYRFPGVDSDYIKQAQIALGQEANKKTFPDSVWPASIPASSVISIGANGQAFLYPSSSATKPRLNPGDRFSLDDLVAEGHLWAGAALDDTITLWAELTIATGGPGTVEHAQVLFNDLIGPRHAVNFVVGRGFPTLTSFAPHSSYLGDQLITNLPVTGIYGISGDPFVLVDNFNGLELNGVINGRLDYSVGVTAVKNSWTTAFSSDNVYGHIGYKVGGMRLDGEGSQGPANAMKPWAENAVTVDLFAFRSSDYGSFTDTTVTPPAAAVLVKDLSSTWGAHARGQYESAELNIGGYWQSHSNASLAGSAPVTGFPSVKSDVEWAELSYVVFPWMVPAVRAERIGLRPSGVPGVSDWHVMPGIAFLIRANLKVVLVANIELTNGFPQDGAGTPLAWMGGNADWGNFIAAPKPTSTPSSNLTEFESLAVFLAWAM